MCVRVRGQKGQDDGNKRNEGDADVHLSAATVENAPRPVNPGFFIMTIAMGRAGNVLTASKSIRCRSGFMPDI